MLNSVRFVKVDFFDLRKLRLGWPCGWVGLTNFVRYAAHQDWESCLVLGKRIYGEKPNTEQRSRNFYNLVESTIKYGYATPLVYSCGLLKKMVPEREYKAMLVPQNWLPRVHDWSYGTHLNEGRHRVAVWKAAGIQIAPAVVVATIHPKTKEDVQQSYKFLSDDMSVSLPEIIDSPRFRDFLQQLRDWKGK